MTGEGLTIVLKRRTSSPGGGPICKEFSIKRLIGVRDRFVLIREDGEPHPLLTGDELLEIGAPQRGDNA